MTQDIENITIPQKHLAMAFEVVTEITSRMGPEAEVSIGLAGSCEEHGAYPMTVEWETDDLSVKMTLNVEEGPEVEMSATPEGRNLAAAIIAWCTSQGVDAGVFLGRIPDDLADALGLVPLPKN
jgi:hypothetical protein